MKRRSFAIWLPFILPVIALVCWSISGRVVFTTSQRPVDKVETDLFGSQNTVKVFEPGPLAGYCVGLDAVAAAGGVAVAAAAVIALVQWRATKRNSKESAT